MYKKRRKGISERLSAIGGSLSPINVKEKKQEDDETRMQCDDADQCEVA